MIPLGFFSFDAGDSYELISTAFGTGSSGTISFNSIPQGYKHLQVRYLAKNTSTSAGIFTYFNNNQTTSYAKHQLAGAGSTISSSSATSQQDITLDVAMSTSTTANAFTVGVLDILDYSSTVKNKTLRGSYGSTETTPYIYLVSGLWTNTSAISQLTFQASGNSFNTGSRFSLYGIRG